MLFILHQLGPATVIITDGPKTLVALHNHTLYFLQPPLVSVVHTLGAGDAFTAGFLAGIIKKKSLPDALRLGQINATSVIQDLGAKKNLLTLAAAQKMLQKHPISIQERKL